MIILGAASKEAFEINTIEIPEVLENFRSCIDSDYTAKLMRRSMQSISDMAAWNIEELRGKRFFFALANFLGVRHKGVADIPFQEIPDFIFLSKFYAMFFRYLNDKACYKLKRQFEGLLTQNGDLRELFADLLVGFAYARSGANVSLVDLNSKNGDNETYEFLVEKDGRCLEVEVKTLSSLNAHPYDWQPLRTIGQTISNAVGDSIARFSNCIIVLTLKGRKPDLKKEILPVLVDCLSRLSEANTSVEQGKVGLSYSRYQPQELVPKFLEMRQSGLYRMYVQPNVGFPVCICVRFTEQWGIANNIEKALKDAFGKFSRTRSAVVWLRFSDMTPPEFRPWDPISGDAVLDNPEVRQVLEKYLSEERYSYPTGMVISPDVTSRPIPSGFQMGLVTCFLKSHGLSFDHADFLPEVSPIMCRPLYQAVSSG